MEQGFSSEGFSATTAANAASRAAGEAQAALAKAARGGHAPAKPQTPNAAHSAAEATAKGAALYGNAAKGERAAEESLRGVQSKLMLPAMLQFGGMIAATPLMWVAGKAKLPKVKAAIGSVLKASSTALEQTKITELGQLPANYMSAVAEQASEAGVATWAAGATAKSTALKASGEMAQSKVAEFAKPVTNAISGAFEKFSQTGFAKAIPSAVKNTLGKVRGASVFQVLMTAGVTAGMAATLVGSRAEKKETKAAFDNLVADMGGDASTPFAKAVKQTYATKKKAGVAKTGLELAGGVAEGVMWAMPGVGGMKMMGAMMVPQLCQSLVPECPTLGAHAALAKADAGELKIDAAARTDLWKQLIAIMPNVAGNGGQYNRLTTPIAKEFVARGLTAKQGVQLLNDDKAFTALAGEIFAQQQAAKAALLKDQPKHAEKPVISQEAAPMNVVGAANASNQPSMKLSGKIEHQGTVHHHELKRA